jgi:Ca-activated chloride channel family protein
MFTHAWILPLLFLLPILAVLAWWASRRRRLALARFGSYFLVRTLMTRPRPGRWRSFCESLALMLLICGISGPQWGRDADQPAAPGRDIMTVLDVSRSMLAQDVLPSRLERAKQAFADLSHSLQQRGGHRLGLVAFAGQARVVCPVTEDFDHFRAALAELDASALPRELGPPAQAPVSGTRLGEAIRVAVQAQDPRYRGFQDIIMISDGDDPARDDEWRVGAGVAREQGIPVHTIGVGDPAADCRIPIREGEYLQHKGQTVQTRLREAPLEQIAQWTQGSYTPARTQTLALGELFRDRLEHRAERDSTLALPLLRQRYAWFLAPALVLLAVEMAVGRWRRPGRPDRT